jgi:glycine cleavage system aminomethyltransferase T
MSNLNPGQARYGLLLNENGIVVDDGIVARLGPQHYWVNTTSAGVERTTAAFEEWLPPCPQPVLSTRGWGRERYRDGLWLAEVRCAIRIP